MNKYGLIGNNISYSKSPLLHNIISKHFNLNISYELIDIDEDMINGYLNNKDYKGFNITKPFKEIVFNKVNSYDLISTNIGAINTISRNNDNKLIGSNTDYYGFEYLIDYYKIDVTNKKVAILGTGGAAMVCYYYLLNKANKVLLVSRSNKGENIISYEEYNDYEFDIIINATTLGTINNLDSPLTKKQVNNSIVIDLNYNPSITKLMSYSKESYNGLVMLVVQALYSHKIWNNLEFNNSDINIIMEVMKNV